MTLISRIFTIILLGCVPWLPINAEVIPESLSITAITSDQRPITGAKSLIVAEPDKTINLTVLNLDAVSVLEKHLSANLSKKPVQAQQELEHRINKEGRSELESKIRSSYQAILLSLEFGINRYPAIIFDKQSVIYGVTDLATALNIYRKWLNSHQERAHD